MISISIGLAYIGLVRLSLSLKRHFQLVWPLSVEFLDWRLRNRIAGYVLLGLSLSPCVMAKGFGVGLVYWFSIIAAAAFLQAMLITYYPKGCLLFSVVGVVMIIAGLLL